MGGTCCVTSRKQEQVSRAILWLPWFITNQMLKSVQLAEEKLKRPPTVFEIFVEFKIAMPRVPVNTVFEMGAMFTSLFREDWIYMDETAIHFSLVKHPGFCNYSERFREKYGSGYACARDGSIVAKTARTINHANLLNMLKSKDEQLFKDNAWIFDGEFKFCDGEKLASKISFSTYPRSGNSFLRKYLEQMTGITTGATVSLHTATSLQVQGLMGEYIVDDRTWIIKAHHPMYLPGALTFNSDKIVCCVRNPLDVFQSYASLSNTCSHSGTPDYKYHEDYPEWWDWWVTFCAESHARFFETTLR